jgi:CHAT domain-containing protein/tetratricopeptide (TPR) repeat protein
MKRGPLLFSLLASLAIFAASLEGQATTPAGSTRITLAAGQKQMYSLSVPPGTIALLQLDLEGGLLAVQASEAPRRVLDLGRGGRLLFAVTSSTEGVVHIDLSSAEQTRTASVIVRDVTSTRNELERRHLLAAGIAFAQADTTRRRVPGAPSAQEALKLYDQAATEALAAHDASLAQWAMTQKARFLIYQQSKFTDAHVVLDQTLASSGETIGDAVQALSYKTLSVDDSFMGDSPSAIHNAEHALALYRTTGDLYWQGIVLGNLISLYAEAGRDDDALAAGREALADSEQTLDPAGVVFTLAELGTLYREQGKYEDAFQTLRRSIAWGEKIHYAPLIEAEIEEDFGAFYLDLGLWKEAEEQLHLSLLHASPDSQTALDARGMLARVLENNGKTQEALREYGAAIAIADKLKLKPEEVTLRLRRSSAWLHDGQLTGARDDLAKATQLIDELKLPALALERDLAEGALEERLCAACANTREQYEQALAGAQQLGEREQEATADAALARVYHAQKDDVAALQSIEAALSIAERSRASLANSELAASYLTGRHSWYVLAIDLSMQLDRSSPGKGYSDKAFRYAERDRARTMLDAIGGNISIDNTTVTVNLRQRLAVNGRRIEKEKSLLLASREPTTTASALHSLYTEQDALTAELHHSSSRQLRLGDDSVATLNDVQQSLLHRGDALLAISQGASYCYRWLVTPTSLSVTRQPGGAQLRAQLAALQQMLVERKPPLSSGEDALKYQARLLQWNSKRDGALLALGQRLLPSLPSGVTHLYIVADGAMLSLPWGALRVSCGPRACYALERYAISIEPSASIAVSLARATPKPQAQKVMIVAGTITSNDRAMPRWTRLTPLPGTLREADSIARLVPANHLLQLRGREATTDNVLPRMNDDLAILHLSTHTLLINGHPELSGIMLSSDLSRSDGATSVLWLQDIPSLHAPPLVTLSGCTTEGTNISGEELTTLTQAFFYAGAEQVIGSIWSVDDEATATLMGRFYRYRLIDKMSVSEAMRLAQLSMLQDHAPLPDWAGFVVNGVEK